jgi:Mg-chelatase subunit ChlD
MMSDIIRLPDKNHPTKPEKPNTIRLQDKDQLLQKVSKQVVLLIDGSSSMDNAKKGFATSGAVAFAQGALEKNYSVPVIGFSTEARLICKPTTDMARLRKSCQSWPVSGGTFVGAGLNAAASLGLSPADVIVVVTDGACGQPNETLVIASKLKTKGIEILAIGTDDADQLFLQQLASRPDLGLKVEVGRFASAISDASKLLKS